MENELEPNGKITASHVRWLTLALCASMSMWALIIYALRSCDGG